jgi:hypothetical protein
MQDPESHDASVQLYQYAVSHENSVKRLDEHLEEDD